MCMYVGRYVCAFVFETRGSLVYCDNKEPWRVGHEQEEPKLKKKKH